jgi:hypothetical protein
VTGHTDTVDRLLIKPARRLQVDADTPGGQVTRNARRSGKIT